MIICGDCLIEMAKMEPNSIDAIVTDPPYGLEFMGKEWDSFKVGRSEKYASGGAVNPENIASRSGKGGAGPQYTNRPAKRCAKCGKQKWSGSPCKCEQPEWIIDNSPLHAFENFMFVTFREALRVAKPGAHLLAFGGTRTFHRLACAIEDAGWEIRDNIGYLYGPLLWGYGSGFPKSHNIGCKCRGVAVQYNHETVSQETMPNMREVLATDESVSGQEKQNVRTGLQRPEDQSFQEGEKAVAADNMPPVREKVLSEMGSGEQGNILQSSLQRNRAGQKPSALFGKREGEEKAGEGTDGREESGMEGRGDILPQTRELQADKVCTLPAGIQDDGPQGRICDGASPTDGNGHRQTAIEAGGSPSQESQPAGQSTRKSRTIRVESGAQDSRICQTCGGLLDRIGYGSALKPAFEPIILARKPLDGTLVQNSMKWGTGAINVDGCRVESKPRLTGTRNPLSSSGSGNCYLGSDGKKQMAYDANPPSGRWPANLIHDGSDEVLELFPQTGPGMFPPKRGDGQVFGKSYGADQPTHKTDSGSAARFFYCAKASRKEREMGCEGMPLAPSGSLEGGNDTRNGKDQPQLKPAHNHHPTVKPLALMRYLCRLVTPPAGTILDPFMGSGTTLIAAEQEGCRAVGIELNEEYCEIARRRTSGTLPQ